MNRVIMNSVIQIRSDAARKGFNWVKNKPPCKETLHGGKRRKESSNEVF